jgi:hypothetical protein
MLDILNKVEPSKPLNHLENTSLKNDSVFVVEDHSFKKDNNDRTHAEIK